MNCYSFQIEHGFLINKLFMTEFSFQYVCFNHTYIVNICIYKRISLRHFIISFFCSQALLFPLVLILFTDIWSCLLDLH